jgi:hypothetical protein
MCAVPLVHVAELATTTLSTCFLGRCFSKRAAPLIQRPLEIRMTSLTRVAERFWDSPPFRPVLVQSCGASSQAR